MDKLKALLEVKKIIAILLTLMFCVLSFKKIVPVEFITIYSMVIGYYFGQSSVRAAITETISK